MMRVTIVWEKQNKNMTFENVTLFEIVNSVAIIETTDAEVFEIFDDHAIFRVDVPTK